MLSDLGRSIAMSVTVCTIVAGACRPEPAVPVHPLGTLPRNIVVAVVQ
jgi:hypothetical protein